MRHLTFLNYNVCFFNAFLQKINGLEINGSVSFSPLLNGVGRQVGNAFRK